MFANHKSNSQNKKTVVPQMRNNHSLGRQFGEIFTCWILKRHKYIYVEIENVLRLSYAEPVGRGPPGVR